MGKGHTDKNQRKATQWVRKFKRSALSPEDPITALARHFCDTGDDGQNLWSLDLEGHDPMEEEAPQPGVLYFSPPEAWLEQHPFSLPNSLDHHEGEAEPFARSDGLALAIWLKPSALSPHLSLEDAREQVRQRADRLGAAIAKKMKIEPLEVRVYFAPQKIVDATAGTDHAVVGALLLASSDENNAKMRTAHKKLMETCRQPKSNLSPDAFEKMLAPHRARTGGLAFKQWSMPLSEVAAHLRAGPQIYTVREDGKVAIPHLVNGKEARLAVAKESLQMSDAHTHTLLLQVDNELCVDHGRLKDKAPGKYTRLTAATRQAGYEQAIDFNQHVMSSFLEALKQRVGGKGWGGALVPSVQLGNLVALHVEGENQKELLEQAGALIASHQHNYQSEDRDWQGYLDYLRIPSSPAHNR